MRNNWFNDLPRIGGSPKPSPMFPMGLDTTHYYEHLLNIQPDYLIGAWPLDDAADPVARDLRGRTTAVLERLLNPGFEIAGAGGADIWGSWTERASTGTLADEVGIKHSGAHSAKMIASASVDTWVTDQISVKPGETLTIDLWAYGDGAHSGRYALYDVTNAVYIQALVTVGQNPAAWANKVFTHVIPAGCVTVKIYIACAATNGATCYFDDISVKGSVNDLSGVYQGVLTHNVAGPLYNTKSTTFPGAVKGAAVIGNASFNSLWNGDKFSAIS